MEQQALEAQIAEALTEYNPARAALAELGAAYKALKTNGLEDRAAFNAVVKARRDIKSKRVAVEKTRKDLKAGALEYGRAVDGAAKEITAELLEIEAHLQAQESLVTDEEARIKREAEEERQRVIRMRMDMLAAVGVHAIPLEVEKMTDEEFREAHDTARAEQEAKKAAEAKAQAEREAEAERLAQEREKLDKERAEVAAMRAELEAAQKAALVEKMEERQEPVLPKLIPATDEDFEQEPARGIVQPDRAELPDDSEIPIKRRPGYFYLVTRYKDYEASSVLEDHCGVELKALRSWGQGGFEATVDEYAIPQEGGAS